MRMGVQFALRHRWTGWDEDGRLAVSNAGRTARRRCRATVLALGGASWPRLGSDGAWVETLAAQGRDDIAAATGQLRLYRRWSDIFRDRFEGQPLKGVALSFGAHTVRGEAMITRTGIEGGAVYALSADLREAIADQGRRRCTSPCGPISQPAI